MTCCRCKQPKNPEDFNWKNKAGGKRDPVCRSCRVDIRRAWYQNHKSEIIKKVKVNNRRYRSEAKKFVQDYLSKHPCVDCGEPDVVVLEFDHVRGKKDSDISRMISSHRSVEALTVEISKCDVRCANCHKRRHHKARVAQSIERGSPKPQAVG